MKKQTTKTDETAIAGSLLLTAAFIASKQFELCPPCKDFEGLNMPYYAMNGVLLFFNTPVSKWNKNDFYVGFGEQRCGKYHAVAFRWINKQSDLLNIYNSITGESI